jgi:hypothetical protein
VSASDDLEIGMRVSDPEQPEREAVVLDFIREDTVAGIHWRGELDRETEAAGTPVVCCEISHLDTHAPGWRTGACRDVETFHAFLDRHDPDLNDGLFMVPADQLEANGYPNHRPPDGLGEDGRADR